MAHHISLISYLQDALPAIPISLAANPGRNTTNSEYEAGDIRSTAPWPDFNLNTILQRYQHILLQSRMLGEHMPTSPPRAITAENALRSKISEYVIPRIRRSLRVGFASLAAFNQMNGLTALSFDVGEHAQLIESFTPDIAYFMETLSSGSGPNRAPGDVKPSWKWSTALAAHPRLSMRTEYRQALSQVNYYMKQHGSRYGFLLTDRELVVFRRVDDDGNLELAPAIPWVRGGTDEEPQLTVLLALWYLGMLAAQDGGPDAWHM